jgi:GTPase
LGKNNHTGSTFYIDRIYNVKGVGLVVTGINRGNRINVNDDMYLGPIDKIFIKVKLKSMHNNNREDVEYLDHHHRGCIALKSKDILKKERILMGMVLISDVERTKNICFHFNAAITIFGGHSSTLRTGYTPIIHAGTVRQSARLILSDDSNNSRAPIVNEEIDKPNKKIKSGDVENVMFKFKSRSEYLDAGTVFVFRSGDLHGVGCVINIVAIDSDPDAQPDPKKWKKKTDPIIV